MEITFGTQEAQTIFKEIQKVQFARLPLQNFTGDPAVASCRTVDGDVTVGRKKKI